jgi:hypothetical protein
VRNFILLLIVILPLCIVIQGCSTSEEPEEKPKTKVIILEDDGTENSVAVILRAAGFDVDMGGPYWEYTGDNIQNYKVVIFLNGVEWGWEMPDTTQQRLRNYVENGGKLLSFEWISWSEALSATLLSDMLPITYGNFWANGSETYYKITDHTITASIPDTFTVSNDWSYSNTILDPTPSKNAVLIYRGSESNAAVVEGDFGSGKVIHWNMGGHYNGEDIWTPEVKQLLINIVEYLK